MYDRAPMRTTEQLPGLGRRLRQAREAAGIPLPRAAASQMRTLPQLAGLVEIAILAGADAERWV